MLFISVNFFIAQKKKNSVFFYYIFNSKYTLGSDVCIYVKRFFAFSDPHMHCFAESKYTIDQMNYRHS